MTISCNHKPVTQAQKAETQNDIEGLVTALKHEGTFPPQTKTSRVIGEIAAYASNSKKVFYDPEVMACFTPEQTKAIILHEAGHVHENHIPGMATSAVVTSMLLFGIIRVYGGLKKIKLKHEIKKKHGKDRKLRIARQFTIAAATLCMWGASTKLNADIAADRETNADMYSARSLGTGEPLASVFELVDKQGITTDKPIKKSGSIDYIIGNIVEFGRYSIFDPHPKNADRIAALRAYRPDKIKVSANYRPVR